MSPISAVAVVFLLAFLLPSDTIATREIKAVKDHFIVQGRIFCDTCRAGYETPATTYIAGAKVRVVCRTRDTGAETCSFDGETDSTGTYNIKVEDDHEHESCEAVLVSSPESGCASAVKGRDTAPVFLTSNNGIASEKRLANAMGFERDEMLGECAEIMKMYELNE